MAAAAEDKLRDYGSPFDSCVLCKSPPRIGGPICNIGTATTLVLGELIWISKYVYEARRSLEEFYWRLGDVRKL
jgi:hypothetical protein